MTKELQEHIDRAREHYDRILDENIAALAEKTGIEKERFIRINPCDFLETISGMVQSKDYGSYNGNNDGFFRKTDFILASPANQQTTEDKLFPGRLFPDGQQHEQSHYSEITCIDLPGVDIPH
jgi:hypothetical protein